MVRGFDEGSEIGRAGGAEGQGCECLGGGYIGLKVKRIVALLAVIIFVAEGSYLQRPTLSPAIRCESWDSPEFSPSFEFLNPCLIGHTSG